MKTSNYTFAGGVLSQSLWGRTDLAKYQTGVKYAHNFLIGVEGGLYKRWGTSLVGSRKFQAANKPAKLISWRIADDDSYILEVGDYYIRFIRLGGYVSIPGGHVPLAGNQAANVDGVMEIATPYPAELAANLRFTFANDIAYINHNSYPERQLIRLGLYDWKLVTTDYDPHPAWTGAGSVVWHNTVTAGDNYVPEPVLTEYKVSATMADGTETKPSAVLSATGETGHRRCWFTISWNAIPGATQYTVYKGKNGMFGFIGYTTGLSFDDRNFAPSYDVVPLDKLITFNAGDYPGETAFYKQRKVYAGLRTQKQRLVISKPALFTSLYKSVPSIPSDAIDVTIVGTEKHSINHMLASKKFIIFTDTAEWILKTEQNAALSAASIDPEIETHYGAHPVLKPIPLGDRILFIQNIGESILDLGYEFTTDAYNADDLSRLARDLFKRKNIVAWASAEFPANLLPVVMSDGTINFLTYHRKHEIWGWATASTDGDFIDVACVTETSEHAIYVQTRRKINGTYKYFIERFEFSGSQRPEELCFLDCSLRAEYSVSFTGLVRDSDTQLTVAATAHGLVLGDEIQIETDEGVQIRAEVSGVPSANSFQCTPLRVTYFPDEIDSSGKVFRASRILTGLGHLYGAQIKVLADGKVYSTLSVASDGTLVLPENAVRVIVGLPYLSFMETLDLDVQNAKGTYYERTVKAIVLHLKNSRGVYVGPSTSDEPLTPILPRAAENMYEANSLLSGAYELDNHPSWVRTAGIRIEAPDPLPCEILNIVPELVYGN